MVRGHRRRVASGTYRMGRNRASEGRGDRTLASGEHFGQWVAFLVRSHSDPMLSELNRSVPVPTLTRLVFHLVSGRYTNEFVLLSQCIGLLFLD